MSKEIKTLDGIMNLDDSNEVMPFTHHKEARNGVFKGSASEMHFTAIRGNSKVDNGAMAFNDCKLAGIALFTPNCNMEGAAVYVPKCELAGTATWISVPITMTTTSSCTAYIGSGKIVVSAFAGGWGTFSFISISTVSAADALSKLDAAGTRSAITAATYTYTNLGNATYYIAIMDIGGLKGSTSTTILCQPEPVSCILNHVCDEFTGSSTVRANTFTGGGGTFQITNTLYTTAAAAIAGTFVDVATATVEYPNVIDGTYYVGLRDKANTANKVAISIISDCVLTGSCSCFTVTNTTANRLDVNFFACNGSASSRVVQANSPEYICVAGGTTPPAVTGLTITRCDPVVPCTTNTTCFTCGDTTPVWVDQNYNTCINCATYDVYKDINPNSTSYNKYKVNGVIDTIQPASGDCITTADYSGTSIGTYYSCIGGQVNEYAIHQNSNACFTGNQYSRGPNGTITYATNPVNEYPDTDRIMVNQNFNYCYNCITYPVFRDKNSCSPTWNEYFVNDTVSLGQTTPPAADCSLATDWRSLAETTCYECANQTIYRDYGECSPTKLKYRIGLTGPVSTTKPTVGNCSTNPSLTAQNYNTCYQCANWAVFQDTNPCSATANRYILNQPPGTTFINVGLTAPANGNCSTAENWVNEGARICVDCTSYQPQRNIAPCSGATYNTLRNSDGVYGAAPCNTTTPSYTSPAGTLHYCTNGNVNTAPVMANTNACYSSMNTAQFRVDFGGGNYIYYGVGANPANSYPNTDANWINLLPVETYYECDGNIRYNQQMDINSCSITAGQIRRGTEFGIVAGYCGYNPVTCTSYDIYNSDGNYDVYISYEQCGGSTVYDSVGPGMTMNICAVADTVNGGGGYVTNVGTCSS
jgi:hypothetical protein